MLSDFKNFLLSPKGGSWDPNCVLMMDRPCTPNELKKLLDMINPSKSIDFLLLYMHLPYDKPFSKEEIYPSWLLKYVSKQINIFDSCLKTLDNNYFFEYDNDSMDQALLDTEKNNTRNQFLLNLKNQKFSQVTLMAASIGEKTAQDTMGIGLYTKSFIESFSDSFEYKKAHLNSTFEVAINSGRKVNCNAIGF